MIRADISQRARVVTRLAVRACLTTLVAVGLGHSVMAAAPTLTHVFPPGGQRGSTVSVTCKGKFDWPVSVAAGGVTITPGTEAGKLDIRIPEEFAADRVWIRLHNAEGASNAVPFLIGSLKEVSEVEPNNAPSKAQKLEGAEVTMNGVLTKGDVDGFAITLEAGQVVVAAVDASTRLGSPIDSILQVADERGFVLAENHDEVGLDPRLVFRASRSGVHVIRLFAFPSTPDSTIAFSGGDTSIYRLTVTTGPFVDHTLPMSTALTDGGAVEPLGWNLAAGTTAAVVPFGGAEPHGLLELEPQGEDRVASESRLGLVFSPQWGGSARVRLTPYPASANIGHAVDEIVPLAIPGAVTGRLTVSRQMDRYRLSLKKGQPVVIVAEGRSEFPIDPVMQLKDPKGGVVATLDDPSPRRAPILAHTATQDGDYELTIRDRHRRGSDRAFYQLTARMDAPDFELTTSADALVVTSDKPAELTVNVQRRGSGVGAITVEAVDLPEGVTVEPVISETKGDSSKKVKLSFLAKGGAYSGPVRIRGIAQEPTETRRFARTPVQLGACFDTLWLTVVAKPSS
ncbi:hypothetical protein Pan44_22400 [Caulifigura coniformis]|uniref:Subtilase-type serine protease n=1 Tax=Caulifigura coniformis TaxID=2527983 RepID=A0A517SDL3_9PLAN|nr:hypothetical protein [Caulifigura coniformis]QDT54213.1 hypothetical protein Pan44_22400 [Caulifigura coniformis]